MTKLVYTYKIRNRAGKIVGYQLMDDKGQIGSLNAGSLKQAIRIGEIVVDNLKLTSDGRLIDTYRNNSKSSSNELQNLVERVKVLGLEVKRLEASGGQVILIKNKHEYILCIPDDVEELNSIKGEELVSQIDKLEGKIRVLGGSGLNNLHGMFEYTKFSEFDLSKLEAHGIVDMSSMFRHNNADSLNLSGLDTSRVVNVKAMFADMRIRELDLSKFDMSKVINAQNMFTNSNIIKLKLNELNLSNVKLMKQAFFNTNIIEDLDMSTLKLNEDCDVKNIFKYSRMKKLILNEKQKSLIREAKRSNIETEIVK